METKIGIEGMSCGSCVMSVEKAISRVFGVKSVRVSLEKNEATVLGDGFDMARIRAAIEDAGYDLRDSLSQDG